MVLLFPKFLCIMKQIKVSNRVRVGICKVSTGWAKYWLVLYATVWLMSVYRAGACIQATPAKLTNQRHYAIVFSFQATNYVTAVNYSNNLASRVL